MSWWTFRFTLTRHTVLSIYQHISLYEKLSTPHLAIQYSTGPCLKVWYCHRPAFFDCLWTSEIIDLYMPVVRVWNACAHGRDDNSHDEVWQLCCDSWPQTHDSTNIHNDKLWEVELEFSLSINTLAFKSALWLHFSLISPLSWKGACARARARVCVCVCL